MAARRRNNTPAFPHLLPWEDENAYAARLDDLVTAYSPKGPMEQSLVERIALLLQRRDRLALAERALHMAALEDATHSEFDVKRLARRAGAARAHIETPDDITDVVAKSEADDANDRTELEQNRKATAETLSILQKGGDGAYERALAALDDTARTLWTERLDIKDGQEAPEYSPDAESLAAYLQREITSCEDAYEAELDARPALRMQAWGESLDPSRMERLLAIDAQQDRQLERAVGMLMKLQQLRGAPGASQ